MNNAEVCDCCIKQKTAYEMRISDWSADVCSSDLSRTPAVSRRGLARPRRTNQPSTHWRCLMTYTHPDPKAAIRHIAVAALIAGLALAQSGYAAAHDTASGPRLEGLAPPAAGQSPFLGKWELDLARMPDTYGPAPKRELGRAQV